MHMNLDLTIGIPKQRVLSVLSKSKLQHLRLLGNQGLSVKSVILLFQGLQRNKHLQVFFFFFFFFL